MSKQLFRITPLLILSIFLTACGGSSSSSDSGADGNSTNNTAPIANAGADVDITKGFIVNLNGSASSDSDGDTLTYEWTQTKGIDVTSGSGSLSGENPVFSAPDGVDSLVFELKVNDGKVSSTVDTVVVNVYEDLNATYFVDGDNGDDSTGDGSRSNPFATLAKAILALTTNQEDIYMKTRAGGAAYDETASSVEIPAGTSVYGGYDTNWIRDVETNKTMLNTDHRGMQFLNVIQDAWFSGFNLNTLDTTNVFEDVYGVKAQGDKTSAFYVTDNIINNGQVAAGTDNAPGSNYGVVVLNLAKAEIRNNQILASNAGDGINGVRGVTGGDGDAGDAGTQTSGNRAAGGATGAGGNGGAGGTRGGGFNGSGGGGGKGGDKFKPLGGTASGGGGGAGGSSTNTNADSGETGGGGGLGSPGAAGNGTGLLTGTLFIRSNGSTGSRGGHGAGGGGGGGGKANNVGVIGGGGGGGGEGGEGGFGGAGGRGGGASIGVWLFGIVTSDITNNMISSAAGGGGASGGAGGAGGARGTGGAGKAGDSGFFGAGGGGAKGGDGGTGGSGGYGGAGGGGPSYGVIFSAGMEPRFTGNTITSGSAGAGGNGGFRGNGGEGGYSYTIFDSNPDDAFFATVDQNMLINGSSGAGGSSSGFSGATAGNNGLSATNNWNL